MPYMHDGDLQRDDFHSTFISTSAIKREYTLIGLYEIEDTMVELFLLKATPKVIGCIPVANKDGESSNRVIFALHFKQKNTLVTTPAFIHGHILQVDKVSIAHEYGNYGIASFVYAQLAKHGFAVLSDTSQFAPGAALWQKLAKRAHLTNYNIYVLDDEYGFIKDAKGDPVVYNGSNISSAKIWTNGGDFDGQNKLLLMQV